MMKRPLIAFALLLALAVYCFAALPVNVNLLVNGWPAGFTVIYNLFGASTSNGGYCYTNDGYTYEDCATGWTNDTFANDQYASVTLKNYAQNNDMWVAPAVRMSGSNQSTMTAYVLYIGYSSAAGHDYSQLYLRQNGGWTTMLAHDNATQPHTGDVYEIHVVGNSITTKRNGTTYLTATDSTLTSGKAGIWFYTGGGSTTQAGLSISNFTAGNETSSRRRPPVVALAIPRQAMQ